MTSPFDPVVASDVQVGTLLDCQVWQLSPRSITDLQRDLRTKGRAAVEAGLLDEQANRLDQHVLSDLGVYPFRGTPVFALVASTGIVSLNATYFSKGDRKNAWGRYINLLTGYTVPLLRRRGYASGLQLWLQRAAVEAGYSRVKSLTSVWLGFTLHAKCGHHFYGPLKNGIELLIDTPISGESFPDGIPYGIRSCKPTGRLGAAELLPILTNPHLGFGQSPEVVTAALAHFGIL